MQTRNKTLSLNFSPDTYIEFFEQWMESFYFWFSTTLLKSGKNLAIWWKKKNLETLSSDWLISDYHKKSKPKNPKTPNHNTYRYEKKQLRLFLIEFFKAFMTKKYSQQETHKWEKECAQVYKMLSVKIVHICI